MNRNTNAHFANLPSVDIQRSVLDRSHSHKTSGNVGQLIPIYCDPDIMPGDTVSIDTSKVIRFQTLLTPMMDNIQCDVYWYFVPNRLLWDHWPEFMGENSSSAWIPAVEYTIPQLVIPISSTTGSFDKSGTILDYLGIPVGMNTGANSFKVNALPTRGYAKICNDWYISESVNDPINLYTGDNDQTAVATGNGYVDDCAVGGDPFIVAKYHDYFTSALPSPQKGPAVAINLEGTSSLPVVATSKNAYAYINSAGFQVKVPDSGVRTNYTIVNNGASSNNFANLFAESMNNVGINGFGSYSDATSYTPASGDVFAVTNMWTAAPKGLSFTVNDMRYAFQLQKLLERDARGGTRYIEIIRSHFGVISPDARLQRSEYLGGNRFAITVDQVSNTAQTENDFLGDLGAFSVSSDVHSDFTHSFTEHGILYGLMVVRYDHTYTQGIPKSFLRKSRFDYYWPVFANIGEQPIRKVEIFFDGTQSADTPFGYQEAWADLRYAPNRCSGEMRPYVANGLYSWTLADDYNSEPSLSADWLKEEKSNVDRVLAVTSQVANQFWADIYFNAKYTRPMPVYSIPGLIDHN